MLKKFLSIALTVLTLSGFLMITSPALAQTSVINPNDTKYETGSYDANDILNIVINVTKIILGIVGSLTLLMFIYGGFSFLISAGSSEKVSKAKGILTAAVIGLIIVFSSYIIIKFVLATLGRDDFDGNLMKINQSASGIYINTIV